MGIRASTRLIRRRRVGDELRDTIHSSALDREMVASLLDQDVEQAIWLTRCGEPLVGSCVVHPRHLPAIRRQLLGTERRACAIGDVLRGGCLCLAGLRQVTAQRLIIATIAF